MKFGGQLRRFPACDLDAMRLLFARMIIGLPLRDPVRAHPRAIRLHLLTQHVQLAFQSFGAPIELELRKTLGQDGLNVVQRMRLEQIQDHRDTKMRNWLSIASGRPVNPFVSTRDRYRAKA